MNGEVFAYDKDGASLYSSLGKAVWKQAYTMSNPMLSRSNNYIVIYDREGNDICIFNSTGCIGNIYSNRSIMKAVVSSQGVVATIQEESTSGYNYIEYYNKDGSRLDIDIRTTLAESGYPLDIDISEDGTELVISYIYVDSGVVNNQIIFYNFDIGKNDPSRIVGGFADYNSIMVPEVAFFGNTRAVAFADSKIDFYSLENASQPVRSSSVELGSQKIKSVFYNEDYLGYISYSEENYNLCVYKPNGKKCFEKEIDFEATKAKISGDSVILINDSSCQIYNVKGRLKYEGSFNDEGLGDGLLEDVTYISDKTYAFTRHGVTQKIKFK
ncbi:hypothetical protein P261_01194 [Lachnospiraceae bacterium TWA4]|nr:hypothetical protein P261_01194 [Lachnospiraceae bacterium TWA4]